MRRIDDDWVVTLRKICFSKLDHYLYSTLILIDSVFLLEEELNYFFEVYRLVEIFSPNI
jgi:hypothetical protein